MAIIFKLETILTRRRMAAGQTAGDTTGDLTEVLAGLTQRSLSALSGKPALPAVSAATGDLGFSTLEAICERLDCQPGDILTYAENQKTPPRRFRWVNRL